MQNMDLNVHDDTEKVEPGELLEDCWFFGNLLHRKSRMLRSYSDPCTSSNYSQDNLPGKSYEETYESIKKLPGNDEFTRPNLIRAPSEPSSLERQNQKATTKGSDPHRSKRSNRKQSSSKNLVRAPSLPTSLETEEFQDEEIEFSMGKLIRQASMKNSDTLPPRIHATKSMSPNSSTSRHRSRKKPELESIKMEGLEDIKPQRPINQLKTQKSLIDLDSDELQGFKDLGFDLDKKNLSPNVINIIPEDEEKNSRKPYLSEAWGPRSSSAPPVPKWGGKKSTEDVMKAQIKFWARAVASNVRQEC
ncbi:hypothetical protein DH2020_033451 [Rehmannia glutinosa]|uniref:Uncharacterized protein n=1 Tax=Rehmannia glutinosa TaxID=99300 RepID=A0ABR0VCN0_REHGL